MLLRFRDEGVLKVCSGGWKEVNEHTHFGTSLGDSKAVGVRWMEELKMTQRALAQATKWTGYTQHLAQENE